MSKWPKEWVWGKTKLDLEFVDTVKTAYLHYPPRLAAKETLKTHKLHMEKYGSHKFAHCPGIMDYSKLGYIIPAWCDIRIKANKAGTQIKIGSLRGNRRFEHPEPMSNEIIDGVMETQDTPLQVWKVNAPWNLFTNQNVSAILLAPIYHASWTDDVHLWPGSVDYGQLTTINAIMSAKRQCNITINAGEPLIHVIPFINKDNWYSGYGTGTQQQVDYTSNLIPTDASSYYRKFMTHVRRFMLRKNDETDS